ncbi:TerD family protein [Streptomyces sp. E11-3]|uniref:TerD family protein n=1 Tax=Streptomyces sp. E11-3 TaxID=3110112 RepID=UPI00397FB004
MTSIAKGGTLPVPTETLHATVSRRTGPGLPDVDVSALLLDASGKVRGDADLVFYNQREHPSGAVRHLGRSYGGTTVTVDSLWLDLASVEPDVHRIVVAASTDGSAFGQLAGLDITVTTMTGAAVAHFAIGDATTESAFVLGEFYRGGVGWNFRAVGQGYASGLAGIAADFGIAVADEGSAEGPAEAPAPVAHPHPQPQPVPPEPGPPAVVSGQDFTPDFTPYEHEGNRNETVSVPGLPPGPVILEVTERKRHSYLRVLATPADGYGEVTVCRSTERRLRGRVMVHVPDEGPLRLRVESEDRWHLRVLPMSAAKRFTDRASGSGPDVLFYDGPMADLDYRHECGEHEYGNFIVWASYEGDTPTGVSKGTLLANGTGSVEASGPLSGPCLLQLDAEGSWSLAARPVPVSAPADGVLAEYRGQGRNDETMELTNPTPGSAVIMEYAFGDIDPGETYYGDGYPDEETYPEDAHGSEPEYYGVHESDEYGIDRPLLHSHQDGMNGRVLLFTDGAATTRLRLTDIPRWTLRLLPLSAARPLDGPLTGSATEVLAYRGEPAVLRLTGSRQGNPAAYEVDSWLEGAFSDTVVLEAFGARPAHGPLRALPGRVTYVCVHHDSRQGWELGLSDAVAARAFTSAVTGHGDDVVRFTGPPGRARIECADREDQKTLELWSLDEHFAPDRRLATGHGRLDLPTGPLQVRASGRWSITSDG